jgi:hypothetical protein
MDWPLVRSPATGGNFTSYNWPDGTGTELSATSYAWEPGALPGTKIRIYSGYNYTGSYITLTRPSVGSGPWNFPSAWNNENASWAGCGTSCSDEPG